MAQRPFSPHAFGKYFLVDRIAAGGMAEVFRSILRGAAGFEKTVALKRILPIFDHDESEFVTLFQDEARIASTLTHANIAQVFDFGEIDGSYYLTMELVEGMDLAQLGARLGQAGRSFPLAMSAFVVAEAARGLGYAHEKRGPNGALLGIVHRDVSPQNLLLSYAGEVKVADFGIAKAAGKAHRTATGMRMGKLRYMSPEHIAGDVLDARSDIFALGVILHELLTGEPIFPESSTELAHAISATPIPPPSAKVASVPRILDEIVLRALAKPREQRYARASELARDLAKFVNQSAPDFTREDLAALVTEFAPQTMGPGRADFSELALSPTVRSDPPETTDTQAEPRDAHATPQARPRPRIQGAAPRTAPTPPRQLDQPTRTQLADDQGPSSPRGGTRRRPMAREVLIGLVLTSVILASMALVGVRFALPGHEEAESAATPAPVLAAESAASLDAPRPPVLDAAAPPTAFFLTPTSSSDERAQILAQTETHEVASRGVLDARYTLFLTALDSQVATLVVDAAGKGQASRPPEDVTRSLASHPDIALAVTAVMDHVRATGDLPPRVKTALRVFLRNHPAVAPASTVPGYSAAALAVWLFPGDRGRLADLAWANDTLGRFGPAPPPPHRHFAPLLCERAALRAALWHLAPDDPDAAALARWEGAVPLGQSAHNASATIKVRAARYQQSGAGLRLLVWLDTHGAATQDYALLAGGLAGAVSPSPWPSPWPSPLTAHAADEADAGAQDASLAFEVPRRFLAPVLAVGNHEPVLMRLPAHALVFGPFPEAR